METKGKISDKNPFRVPENYFEEVNRKILEATSEKMPETSVFRRIRPFIAAAAAIAVLVTAAYFSVKLFSPANTKDGLSALNTSERTELLMNELDITTIENDAFLSGIKDETPDFSAADIINDLIEENIDINEIYERL